jgi:hypothetical protein
MFVLDFLLGNRCTHIGSYSYTLPFSLPHFWKEDQDGIKEGDYAYDASPESNFGSLEAALNCYFHVIQAFKKNASFVNLLRIDLWLTQQKVDWLTSM